MMERAKLVVCDICQKEYPWRSPFARLEIEWIQATRNTFNVYNMCLPCKTKLKEEMDKLIHNTRYQATHPDPEDY